MVLSLCWCLYCCNVVMNQLSTKYWSPSNRQSMLPIGRDTHYLQITHIHRNYTATRYTSTHIYQELLYCKQGSPSAEPGLTIHTYQQTQYVLSRRSSCEDRVAHCNGDVYHTQIIHLLIEGAYIKHTAITSRIAMKKLAWAKYSIPIKTE